jgi:hypothetical protein
MYIRVIWFETLALASCTLIDLLLRQPRVLL